MTTPSTTLPKTNDANLVVDKTPPTSGGPFTEPVTPPASTAVTTTTTTPPVTPPVSEFPSNRPPLKDPTFLDPLLLYILCEPRKHDTPNEKRFGEWLIKQLNKMKVKPTIRQNGNITVQVGEGKTLFSSHIDTVHGVKEQTTYGLLYDKDFEQVFLATRPPAANAAKGAKGEYVASCLGADDGAGVWLMLKMIEAKVPGGYVFHRGEECGGLGSKEMVAKEEEWIKQFHACVAFDRKADFEVVYMQGGVTCASNTYTDALCKALTKPSMAIKYQPSNGGSFTDSKNYRGLIGECVNVAVGYYNQHGVDEYLDYGHLYALLDIVKEVKWDELPRQRVPYIAPATTYGNSGSTGYGGYVRDQYKLGYDANGLFVGYGHGEYDSKWDADQAAKKPKKGGKTGGVTPFPTTAGKVGSEKSALKNGFLYTSHLEQMYDSVESINDLMVMFEMAPEETARACMRAIIEGRAAEIKADMLGEKLAGS